MIPAAITGIPATAGMKKNTKNMVDNSGIDDRTSEKLTAPGMQFKATERMPATAKT
jgi:hypothetical protein